MVIKFMLRFILLIHCNVLSDFNITLFCYILRCRCFCVGRYGSQWNAQWTGYEWRSSSISPNCSHNSSSFPNQSVHEFPSQDMAHQPSRESVCGECGPEMFLHISYTMHTVYFIREACFMCIPPNLVVCQHKISQSVIFTIKYVVLYHHALVTTTIAVMLFRVSY